MLRYKSKGSPLSLHPPLRMQPCIVYVICDVWGNINSCLTLPSSWVVPSRDVNYCIGFLSTTRSVGSAVLGKLPDYKLTVDKI